MQITIFGSGYVGLVTGACMAEMGNHVVCYDIDAAKIARLNNGGMPIYEPGLEAYIARNVEAGRLEFTTDVERAVGHGLFQFVAVGTSPNEDGSADLKRVLVVARSISDFMKPDRIVVESVNDRQKHRIPTSWLRSSDTPTAMAEGNINQQPNTLTA